MRQTIRAALALACIGTGAAMAAPAAGTETAASQASTPRNAANPAGLSAELAAHLDEIGFSGTLLVARGGNVLLREAVNASPVDDAEPVGTDTRFPIASMSKSFTAALVLDLVDEGRIGLDQTLAELLPDFAAGYADRVTLRQMLQNRSGIPHYIDIPGWFDTDVKAAFTEDSFLAALAALELKFEPGSDYLYSNTNYYLLARIIDRHAGMPYEAFLQTRILDPLGLADTGQIQDVPPQSLATGYLADDAGGYSVVPVTNPALFRGTASMYSTLDDLHRWGQAVMDGSVYSPAAAEAAFDSDRPMAWETGQLPLGEDRTTPATYYNGRLIGYLSLILLLPEEDGIVVVLNNNTAGYRNMLLIASTLAADHFGETPPDE